MDYDKSKVTLDNTRTDFGFDRLKTDGAGLVPVIVQDDKTDEVLMLAYMNEEAYNLTLERGVMTYFSRSRQELWLKGDTSGHFQYVRSLKLDCDLDTILARVEQVGAACHTGSHSCFFNNIAG
jgi:phosphoribosyl-AMP cyclohydrolase